MRSDFPHKETFLPYDPSLHSFNLFSRPASALFFLPDAAGKPRTLTQPGTLRPPAFQAAAAFPSGSQP